MKFSNIVENLKNKKILILGFGREGRSTYLFLRKLFPEKELSIADKNNSLISDMLLESDTNLQFHLGDTYLEDIGNYDFILKTPGISNLVIEGKVSKEKISCQTDLFLQLFGKQTIGISGTKGKSTTTFLAFEILKKYFPHVLLAGNMGIPLLDIIEQITDESLIVCEFSSHQLENINAAPNFSILLNLYQEHLDHYHSYTDYQLAKFNMVKYQQQGDYAIYNSDNNLATSLFESQPVAAEVFSYSIQHSTKQGSFINNESICFKQGNTLDPVFHLTTPCHLKGDHNRQNIMAVITLCKLLNIPNKTIVHGISSFKGLEHRMEYVGKQKGILFYNDSISTIPEATIAAIKSLERVNTLILGGFSRGIDYTSLAIFLNESDIENLVFVGEAGNQILSKLKETGLVKQQYIEENEYAKIIEWCFDVTQRDTICLLSPAASSYDSFKNFEERGNTFKQLIYSHR